MERKVNAGYVITDRLAVGETEFVIGESQTAPARFVTWKCKLGGKDYYWGHYVKDRLSAVVDLCRRALEQAEFLQSLEQQHGSDQHENSQPGIQRQEKRHDPKR